MESSAIPVTLSDNSVSPLKPDFSTTETGANGESASLSRSRGSGQVLKYGVQVSAQARSSSLNEKLCRVPNCPNALLMEGPKYCSRHRICEMHVKCLRVVFDNIAYRFCQKCTRFHLIEEFDKERHTCRKGLEQQRKRRLARSMAKRSDAESAKRLCLYGARNSAEKHTSADSLARELSSDHSPDLQSSSWNSDTEQEETCDNAVEEPLQSLTSTEPLSWPDLLMEEHLPMPRPGCSEGQLEFGGAPLPMDLQHHPPPPPMNVTFSHAGRGLPSVSMGSSLLEPNAMLQAPAMPCPSHLNTDEPALWQENASICPDALQELPYNLAPMQISNAPAASGMSPVLPNPHSARTPALGDWPPTWGSEHQPCNAPQHVSPAVFNTQAMTSLMLKMMSNQPGDLPSDMRASLQAWMRAAPQWVLSTMQPGCVDLRVHVALDAAAAQHLARGGPRLLAQKLMAGHGPAGRFFARNKNWRVTAFGAACMVHSGDIVEEPALPLELRPHLARVVGCCVHTRAAGRVLLSGAWPEGAAVRCLADNQVLPCTVRRVPSGGDTCRLLEVSLPAMPEPLEPRRALVEVEHRGHLVAAPLLLSPRADVVREVARMEAKLAPPELSGILVQLGACLESTLAQPPTASAVWAAAARAAVRCSMPVVLKLLLRNLSTVPEMEAPKAHVDVHGSLLHEATVLGNAAVVDVLLRTRNMEQWVGGLTEVTSKEGATPLHVMARAQDGGAMLHVFTEHASVVRAFFSPVPHCPDPTPPSRCTTSANALMVRNKLKAATKIVHEVLHLSMSSGCSLDAHGFELAHAKLKKLQHAIEAQAGLSKAAVLQRSTLRLAESVLEQLSQTLEPTSDECLGSQMRNSKSTLLDHGVVRTFADFQKWGAQVSSNICSFIESHAYMKKGMWVRPIAARIMHVDAIVCIFNMFALLLHFGWIVSSR